MNYVDTGVYWIILLTPEFESEKSKRLTPNIERFTKSNPRLAQIPTTYADISLGSTVKDAHVLIFHKFWILYELPCPKPPIGRELDCVFCVSPTILVHIASFEILNE